MTIDDIPSFDIPAAVERLTTLWGWLGKDAAQDILDCLAPDIKDAINKGCLTTPTRVLEITRKEQ